MLICHCFEFSNLKAKKLQDCCYEISTDAIQRTVEMKMLSQREQKTMCKLVLWSDRLCCFLTPQDEISFCIFNRSVSSPALPGTNQTGPLYEQPLFFIWLAKLFQQRKVFQHPISHPHNPDRHFYSFCFHLEALYIIIAEAGKVFSRNFLELRCWWKKSLAFEFGKTIIFYAAKKKWLHDGRVLRSSTLSHSHLQLHISIAVFYFFLRWNIFFAMAHLWILWRRNERLISL